MDYFENLQKTLSEGRERWEQIEKLCKTVKFGLDSEEPHVRAMAELLILLVEHIRPMNPSKEQLDETTGEINDMLASLLSSFKK